MPRDFLPCLYTERVLPNAEDYGWVKRCQVIELFALSDVVTEKAGVLLSLNSHAFHRDTKTDDERVRQQLFRTFYAAMAALE